MSEVDGLRAAELEREAMLRFLENEGSGWKPDALWAFEKMRSFLRGRAALSREPAPPSPLSPDSPERTLETALVEAFHAGELTEAGMRRVGRALVAAASPDVR